jgi:dephospho-CoA kinase
MIAIAVTGGAACGKSRFCRSFVEALPEGTCSWFCSDQVVAELLKEDAILCRLRELKGGSSVFEEGLLNRASLRKLVFENSEFREKLEALLHPFVLERAESFRKERLGQRAIVLLEVPLLYEVEFPISRDIELVVAASRATQIKRIMQQRKLSRTMGEQILDSQIPIETKISRSDLVVWNDGSEDLFEAQTLHLAGRCQPYVANDR